MDPQFNLNGGGKKKRVFLTLKEKLQAAALYREHWKIINGYAVADVGWSDETVIGIVRPGAGAQAFKDIRWVEVGKTEKEATRKTQGHGVAGGMAAARANKLRDKIDELDSRMQGQLDNLTELLRLQRNEILDLKKELQKTRDFPPAHLQNRGLYPT